MSRKQKASADSLAYEDEPSEVEPAYLFHSERIIDLCDSIKRLANEPICSGDYIMVERYADEILWLARMIKGLKQYEALR